MVVNNLDQIVSIDGQVISYDYVGNLVNDGTREYRYDAWNRLVAAIDLTNGEFLAQFGHDARGRRVFRTHGGVTTILIHDGHNMIAEQVGGAIREEAVHDPGLNLPVQFAAAGAEWWPLADVLRSTRGLLGVEGSLVALYEYDPFGSLIAPSTDMSGNRWLYAGQLLDTELGLTTTWLALIIPHWVDTFSVIPWDFTTEPTFISMHRITH